MTKARKIALTVLGVAALAGVWHLTSRHDVTVAPAALPIDRETTYLTEPLGPDGRVDYAAAMNATPLPPPDENAALPLLEVPGTDVSASSLIGIW